MIRRASLRRRVGALLGVLVVAALGLWLWTGRAIRYGAFTGATSEPDSSPSGAYVVERVTIATESGRRFVCAVRTPWPPPGERLRALLLAGGRATGRRAVWHVEPGFRGVVMACDYPWSGLLDGSPFELAYRLPRLRAELLATPQLLAAAATYLVARPEVDGERLVGVGVSLGVPAVSAWAAVDSRVRAVALLYGGGDLRLPIEALLARAVRPAPVRWQLARFLAGLLAPIEPVRTVVAIAPRSLLIVGARDDERIPAPSVAALIDAAREPKRVVWLGGEHMRPRDVVRLSQLADTTVAWLDAVMP